MKRKAVIKEAGFIAAAIIFMAAAIGGIWKVNSKTNRLHEAVRQFESIQENMQKEWQKASAQSGSQVSSHIPDLKPHKEGWKITQFGDVMQQQEMCYTITTDTGLVIVDGGQAYEEEKLREIIASYGNHVEAWILTHPHPDHITSFLNIYEDLQGIQIHHVYTIQLPDMETLKKNASWEDYSDLERFRSLDIPGLEYLHKGDRIHVLGLELEVLSAYDETIDKLSNDLMNDGSLLFRVKGREESMLFCADVGSAGGRTDKVRKRMTEYLVETYGDSLKSDYVQMAHHGFQGLGREFYEKVDPKAAFFDAPYWLMNGESEFSSKEKEDMILDMGKTVYSYYTAPNQILLK